MKKKILILLALIPALIIAQSLDSLGMLISSKDTSRYIIGSPLEKYGCDIPDLKNGLVSSLVEVNELQSQDETYVWSNGEFISNERLVIRSNYRPEKVNKITVKEIVVLGNISNVNFDEFINCERISFANFGGDDFYEAYAQPTNTDIAKLQKLNSLKSLNLYSYDKLHYLPESLIKNDSLEFLKMVKIEDYDRGFFFPLSILQKSRRFKVVSNTLTPEEYNLIAVGKFELLSYPKWSDPYGGRPLSQDVKGNLINFDTTVVKVRRVEKTGGYESFYADGSRICSGKFKKGLPIGKWSFWYKDGSLFSERYFDNGIEVGTWTKWDKTGKQILELKFDKGKLVSEETEYEKKSYENGHEIVKVKKYGQRVDYKIKGYGFPYGLHSSSSILSPYEIGSMDWDIIKKGFEVKGQYNQLYGIENCRFESYIDSTHSVFKVYKDSTLLRKLFYQLEDSKVIKASLEEFDLNGVKRVDYQFFEPDFYNEKRPICFKYLNSKRNILTIKPEYLRESRFDGVVVKHQYFKESELKVYDKKGKLINISKTARVSKNSMENFLPINFENKVIRENGDTSVYKRWRSEYDELVYEKSYTGLKLREVIGFGDTLIFHEYFPNGKVKRELVKADLKELHRSGIRTIKDYQNIVSDGSVFFTIGATPTTGFKVDYFNSLTYRKYFENGQLSEISAWVDNDENCVNTIKFKKYNEAGTVIIRGKLRYKVGDDKIYFIKEEFGDNGEVTSIIKKEFSI